jgi:hypothetical protein
VARVAGGGLAVLGEALPVFFLHRPIDDHEIPAVKEPGAIKGATPLLDTARELITTGDNWLPPFDGGGGFRTVWAFGGWELTGGGTPPGCLACFAPFRGNHRAMEIGFTGMPCVAELAAGNF